MHSDLQVAIDKAHRQYLRVCFEQIKLAKAAELTAVRNLSAETLATAKTNLKALLDTTPALSEAVITAENAANLSALDKQWAKRKKELLIEKAAARLKKDSKREQCTL